MQIAAAIGLRVSRLPSRWTRRRAASGFSDNRLFGNEMPALTDSQREQLIDRLHERQAQLSAEVEAVSREQDETPNPIGPHTEVEDFGERGEHVLRTELRHAERERDLDELRAISAALERMADGSYGDCADCGIDIPLKRLEVQPSSERCVPCQQKFEQTHLLGPRILQTP